jgi:hypothetical protein
LLRLLTWTRVFQAMIELAEKSPTPSLLKMIVQVVLCLSSSVLGSPHAALQHLRRHPEDRFLLNRLPRLFNVPALLPLPFVAEGLVSYLFENLLSSRVSVIAAG